jgi:hypothetical protein
VAEIADKCCHPLFTCTGNSASSIMAAVIRNNLGNDRCQAYRAGNLPAAVGRPGQHRLAQDCVCRTGGAASGVHHYSGRSRSWRSLPRVAWPAWPGQPITVHRRIAEPVKIQQRKQGSSNQQPESEYFVYSI